MWDIRGGVQVVERSRTTNQGSSPVVRGRGQPVVMGLPMFCQAPIPPARSYTWVKPAAVICSSAVPERFPLRQ